jgi:hypothetical protein
LFADDHSRRPQPHTRRYGSQIAGIEDACAEIAQDNPEKPAVPRDRGFDEPPTNGGVLTDLEQAL